MNNLHAGKIANDNTATIYHLFPQQPLDICVFMDDGSRHTMKCYDLTSNGIGLQATYEQAIDINPDGFMVNDKSPRTARLLFSLPLESHRAVMDIACHIQYVAIMPDTTADEKFIIGFTFRNMSINTQENLQRYLRAK